MRIRPLTNKVLIRLDPLEDRAGRIIIPEAARKQGDTATLIAKGPGFLTRRGTRWPMPDIEPGARVVVDRGGVAHGAHFEIEGVKHVLMTSDNILGEVTP